MSDILNSIAQNQDGTWLFIFTFDNGKGLTASSEIRLSAKEAPDLKTAYKVSVSKAYDKKKEWLKNIEQNRFIGPVNLD